MQIRTEAEQTAVRRADAVANQARVLQAAHQVFAEQGLAAEIKDIADRAGVGVATIYRGFGSKSGLLQAAVEQASAAVSDSLAAAESAGDPIEGLRTMVIGLLGYAETYGWLIQASLAGEDVVTLRAEERAAKRRPGQLEKVPAGWLEALHVSRVPARLIFGEGKLAQDALPFQRRDRRLSVIRDLTASMSK